MMSPSSFAVFALKFLQKSMMFTPWGPSAVPTGGAGVALPAAIWSFTTAWIFFAMMRFSSRSHERATTPNSCLRGFVKSNLLYLQEIELDRRRSSEDGHHHLQRVL